MLALFKQETTVVVIGATSAGLAAAATLQEAGHETLLIEEGGKAPDGAETYDRNLVTQQFQHFFDRMQVDETDHRLGVEGESGDADGELKGQPDAPGSHQNSWLSWTRHLDGRPAQSIDIPRFGAEAGFEVLLRCRVLDLHLMPNCLFLRLYDAARGHNIAVFTPHLVVSSDPGDRLLHLLQAADITQAASRLPGDWDWRRNVVSFA